MQDERIIVFRQFDSVIDANIAKTKLDAYGIPCFLTEENMSNLYPGQPFNPFKVRLHLFAKDRENALGILSETSLTVETDQQQTCPKCSSSRIKRDFPKSSADNLMFILFGVLFPHKKVNHCINCNNEF